MAHSTVYVCVFFYVLIIPIPLHIHIYIHNSYPYPYRSSWESLSSFDPLLSPTRAPLGEGSEVEGGEGFMTKEGGAIGSGKKGSKKKKSFSSKK
ncbi:hypothetical protein EON63_24575 [archaeon]|nr:MAG: hypothetical protein EON63_24575 [archaeon]